MTTREKLLDIVEGFKEKLTSGEYQEVLLEIAKLPKDEIVQVEPDRVNRSERLGQMPIHFCLTEENLKSIGCGAHKNFAYEGELLDSKYVDGVTFEFETNVEQLMIRNIITGLGYEMGQAYDIHIPANFERGVMAAKTTYPYARHFSR